MDLGINLYPSLESIAGQSLALPDRPTASIAATTISKELCLSVVVPVYNERDTLSEIVRQIRAVPLSKEIIVVDDASTDGTRELLTSIKPAADLRVLLHEQNRGKGAAVRTGFAHATGNVVIIQDADLEYDPRQYGRLIQPILDGKADVVYGSRFLGDGRHRMIYLWHYVANRLLTRLSNVFTHLELTDMETCYKVLRRDVVIAIAPQLSEDRFGIDPEITARIAHGRYRVCEVGISYYGRTYEEGKKIGLRDACRVVWTILRCWWQAQGQTTRAVAPGLRRHCND